jgi:hypothetical protein
MRIRSVAPRATVSVADGPSGAVVCQAWHPRTVWITVSARVRAAPEPGSVAA